MAKLNNRRERAGENPFPTTQMSLIFSNLTLGTAEVETFNVKNVESVLNIVVLLERIGILWG